MKILILRTVHMPGAGAFLAGEVRLVDADLATTLIERGIARIVNGEPTPDRPDAGNLSVDAS